MHFHNLGSLDLVVLYYKKYVAKYKINRNISYDLEAIIYNFIHIGCKKI